MSDTLYPLPNDELRMKRRELTPVLAARFGDLTDRVFADGAIPAKTKHLIAVAAAHVTRSPYCIKYHTAAALAAGLTQKELMEAIWVAILMSAGASFSHTTISLAVMAEKESSLSSDQTTPRPQNPYGAGSPSS
jgi:AhpD family alkylhydroperoxidase